MSVKNLFKRRVIVDVYGEKCELHPPAPSAVPDIIALAGKAAGNDGETDTKKLYERNMKFVVKCVRATSKEVKTDAEAELAIVCAGGTSGAFAQAAIELSVGRSISTEARDAEENFTN